MRCENTLLWVLSHHSGWYMGSSSLWKLSWRFLPLVLALHSALLSVHGQAHSQALGVPRRLAQSTSQPKAKHQEVCDFPPAFLFYSHYLVLFPFLVMSISNDLKRMMCSRNSGKEKRLQRKIKIIKSATTWRQYYERFVCIALQFICLWEFYKIEITLNKLFVFDFRVLQLKVLRNVFFREEEEAGEWRRRKCYYRPARD